MGRALGLVDLRMDLPDIAASTIVMTGIGDYATPAAMGRTIAAGINDAVFQESGGMARSSSRSCRLVRDDR